VILLISGKREGEARLELKQRKGKEAEEAAGVEEVIARRGRSGN